MSRVKSSVTRKKKVKKILKAARGAYQERSKRYRRAKETVQRALSYATRDRKVKKRQFRRLWITRINAALRSEGMKYSDFIAALKKKNVIIDRSILQQLALSRPEVFKYIVNFVKES